MAAVDDETTRFQTSRKQRGMNGHPDDAVTAAIYGHRGYVLAGARATVPTQTPREPPVVWRDDSGDGNSGGLKEKGEGRGQTENFRNKTRKNLKRFWYTRESRGFSTHAKAAVLHIFKIDCLMAPNYNDEGEITRARESLVRVPVEVLTGRNDQTPVNGQPRCLRQRWFGWRVSWFVDDFGLHTRIHATTKTIET